MSQKCHNRKSESDAQAGIAGDDVAGVGHRIVFGGGEYRDVPASFPFHPAAGIDATDA